MCQPYKQCGETGLYVDLDKSVDYINHMVLVSQIDMAGVPRVIPTRSKKSTEQSQIEQGDKVNAISSDQDSNKMASVGDGSTAPPAFSVYPPPPINTIPEIGKIITDDKRGDPGAVSDALNQIYFLMYEGNKSSQEYRSYTEEQFKHLNDKFENVKSGLDTVKSKLDEQGRDLKKLKSDTAPKKDLKKLEQNFETFKKHVMVILLKQLKIVDH